MTENLKQLNLGYSGEEDRLLLRISTNQNIEHQIWLTRRIVCLLWPIMLEGIDRQMLSPSTETNLSNRPEIRRELMAMQHEESLPNVDLMTSYEVPTKKSTMEPLLPSSGQCSPLAEGGVSLNLKENEGKSINLRLPRELFHGFCYQLINATQQADWNLSLKIEGETDVQKPSSFQH